MKKWIFVLCLFTGAQEVVAQDKEVDDAETKKPLFKAENVNIGGGVNVAFFSNGGTALGINPYIGYSVTNWLDVALAVNFNYVGYRNVTYNGDKVRQTLIAPGAFLRLFPVNFLFVQAQYDKNFLKQRYISPASFNAPDEKYSYQSNSLLLGAGYCTGRDQGSDSYFYFSVLYDVLEQQYSPNVDSYGRAYPIIRAGVNIKLFPHGGRGKK